MDQRGIEGGDQWRTLSSYESETWPIDVTKVGSSDGAISDMSIVVLELPDGTDRTEDVTEGEMGSDGQIITLKRIKNLMPDTNYKVSVLYRKDNEDRETRFFIKCPPLEE